MLFYARPVGWQLLIELINYLQSIGTTRRNILLSSSDANVDLRMYCGTNMRLREFCWFSTTRVPLRLAELVDSLPAIAVESRRSIGHKRLLPGRGNNLTV